MEEEKDIDIEEYNKTISMFHELGQAYNDYKAGKFNKPTYKNKCCNIYNKYL